MVRELIREGGRRVWREGVFFPRYLFVRIEGQWRFLLSTIGVVSVIKSGGDEHPAVLDDEVVRILKSREERGFIQIPASPLYAKGQRVRMEHGCFAGLEGIYKGADSLERETVLLNLLGRVTPVSVSTGSITSVT
jgi:transcriptional antiterminator RfaH